MRAVQIIRFGGPEVLDVVELPDPVPWNGEQLFDSNSSGSTSLIPTTGCPERYSNTDRRAGWYWPSGWNRLTAGWCPTHHQSALDMEDAGPGTRTRHVDSC